MSEVELKPCPFCGGKAYSKSEDAGWDSRGENLWLVEIGSMLRKAPKLLRNCCETRCEMIPRLKWHERLLGWVLLRFETARGFGGFHEIDTAAMEWYLKDDHMFYGAVCGLMRDYIYVRMARELERERRNG